MSRLLFAALTFTSLLMASCGAVEEADLVVHNGTIYQVDEHFNKAQAMAIRDGKILELGPEHHILNKYRAAEKLDLRKRVAFPGFIDAHCHFLWYGLTRQRVDLVGCASYEELLTRTDTFSRRVSGHWIQGTGWDQNLWPEVRFPNKAGLDRLFPERPVVLRRIDGHAVLANQRALDLAGITPETKVEGGEIWVENGELTGILIDRAYELVEAVIPPPTPQEQVQALLEAQRDCFKLGITMVADAGLQKAEIEQIQTLQEVGELKMRVYAMLSDSEENFDHFLAHGPIETERLMVKAFKFFADGALGSRGACLLEPYTDDPQNHGLLLHPADYFREYAQVVYDAGFQMNTHCIGDSTNRMMLDIYGEVLQQPNDRRWRIEHAQIVHPNDLEKFRQFSVLPSVQPTHAISDLPWAHERLGDRVANGYRFKTLLEQNGLMPLGTDFPVEAINPMATFLAAVRGANALGEVEPAFPEDQRLTREQALRGMTIWAALANFSEGFTGSLEVGKCADLVVLNGDLMTVSAEALPKIEVMATVVNGEVVYRR